jgi:hypothetical protein
VLNLSDRGFSVQRAALTAISVGNQNDLNACAVSLYGSNEAGSVHLHIHEQDMDRPGVQPDQIKHLPLTLCFKQMSGTLGQLSG